MMEKVGQEGEGEDEDGGWCIQEDSEESGDVWCGKVVCKLICGLFVRC